MVVRLSIHFIVSINLLLVYSRTLNEKEAVINGDGSFEANLHQNRNSEADERQPMILNRNLKRQIEDQVRRVEGDKQTFDNWKDVDKGRKAINIDQIKYDFNESINDNDGKNNGKEFDQLRNESLTEYNHTHYRIQRKKHQGVSIDRQKIQSKRRGKQMYVGNALDEFKYRWPNRLIPYLLSGKFSDYEMKQIAEAMRSIVNISCFSFRPKSAKDGNRYLDIRKTNKLGCYTRAGYSETRIPAAEMFLQENKCFRTSYITHLLLHVMGFLHMHQVSDRDKYIEVTFNKKTLTANIMDWHMHDFVKIAEEVLVKWKFPYDPHSIMHYKPNALTNNWFDVIAPKEPGTTLGGNVMSKLDKLKISEYYECGPWGPNPYWTFLPEERSKKRF